MTRISFEGIDKVKGMLMKFPKKLEDNISKTNERFMKAVRKSAKLRAPRDTGSLAEDIKMIPARKGKKVKIWKISVKNPAAMPQEFGFDPHLAPILNSSKMPPGIYYVRKNTPFLRPAVEHNLKTFGRNLNKAVRRAISP